jgi:hypothetical protein
MKIKSSNRILHFLMMFVLAFSFFQLNGQVTKIMGKVIDGSTGQPVPFANVFFNGTTIGVTSDFDGNYSLETKTPSDTLVASYMGYYTLEKKIAKNKFQVVDFILKPKNFNLAEVVVVAGENPADILLRKIIANKENNSKDRLDFYQYEVYNKMEVDANNISEKFKNRKLLKPFKFIFENIDTSTINGKTYLPIFLSESLSDYYFRKSPHSEKEIIKAAKTSGVENESVVQFLGNMFQEYSFYNNYIQLFQKNFISPISNSGLGTYKYYLIDSSFLGNNWCYKLMFKPRRRQELTFTGHMWVADTSFAIKSFEVRIADDANINYINDLVLRQEFEFIDGKYWMVVKDEGIGDFNPIENSKVILGFFGRKTTTFKNFVFNSPMEKKFYSTPANVIVAENAYKKEEEYWDGARHDSLSKDELTIYHMVDTIKNLPAFRTIADVVKTVVTGYYKVNKFEFGPYGSIISFNAVEGARFRFGGRTTAEFNDHIRLSGHVAYGTLDTKVKYGVGLLYLANQNPRRAFGGNYRYDVEQLGSSPNALREDFFLTALFRRNPADKLSMTSEFSLYYEHEWFNGFINKMSMIRKEIIPLGGAKIEIYDTQGEVEELSLITTSEIRFDLRFAYNEKFLLRDFDRNSLGTRYPIIMARYSLGIPDFMGSDFSYHKVELGARYWFNVFNLGWSKVVVSGGKIWGTLPFPILKLHAGNETFVFDEYSYNLMNYFEFVSDEYVNLFYTHHFDGFFLNHIPLMRRLKWREVAFFHGVLGTLNDANKTYNKLPSITHTLEKPYMEAGIGIENIFKIIRIDGIWRLSHLDNQRINKFALFVSLHFTF